MCPDKSILSAWFDGEVHGKWTDQISDHLENCRECSSYIAMLREQRTLLQSLPSPDFQESLERVKIRIREKNTISGSTRFWQKRVPVPMAAAAAVVAATVALGTHMATAGNGNGVEVAKASDGNYNARMVSLPEDKVNEIFKKMEASDKDEFSSNSIVELPPDVSLIYNGESQLVRTAGFERSPSR